MFLSDSWTSEFGIVSIDATMQSNVSVGPPIDILCYESDSLRSNMRVRLDEDDPYLAGDQPEVAKWNRQIGE